MRVWDRTRCATGGLEVFGVRVCTCHSDDLEPYDCAACGCGVAKAIDLVTESAMLTAVVRVAESAGGHTPTPWAEPFYEVADGDQGWWIHNSKQGGEEYAIAVTFSLNPCGEADARFIVRAVNSHEGLVEALRKMLDTVQWMSGSADFGPGGHAESGWRSFQSDIAEARRVLEAEGKL